MTHIDPVFLPGLVSRPNAHVVARGLVIAVSAMTPAHWWTMKWSGVT